MPYSSLRSPELRSPVIGAPSDRFGESFGSSAASFSFFFDDTLDPTPSAGFAATPKWRPPTDVYETEEAYHVVMDLACIRPEDVAVELIGEMLVVRGVRPERARGKRHYHSMEIQVGPFERRVRLGRPVRADAIEATYERGYLEIHLPKAKDPPSGLRRIPIR